MIGENAIIECSASGAPRPIVNWTRSVSPLPQGRSQQNGGRLNITDMQTQDSGNYTCEASNKRGVISTTAELVVRPPGDLLLLCRHHLVRLLDSLQEFFLFGWTDRGSSNKTWSCATSNARSQMIGTHDSRQPRFRCASLSCFLATLTTFSLSPSLLPGNCNFDRNFCGFTSTGWERVPGRGGKDAGATTCRLGGAGRQGWRGVRRGRIAACNGSRSRRSGSVSRCLYIRQGVNSTRSERFSPNELK